MALGKKRETETATETTVETGDTKKQEIEKQHVPELLPELAFPRQFSDDDMRDIKSFDDARQLIAEKFGEELNYSQEFGTGFSVLADKDELVGKPFIILEWRINKGDWGEFVSASLITESNARHIINDGSSGIYSQLATLTYTHNKRGGLMVDNGLRKSEYPTCLDCGRPRPQDTDCGCGNTTERRATGTTYYLAQ